MGKLAFILRFILSVFPADTFENRRHVHVVQRGRKKTHKGHTVAKTWIEKDGEKKIETAWSIMPAKEEKMILDAIDDNWTEINRLIDKVFEGDKITVKRIK